MNVLDENKLTNMVREVMELLNPDSKSRCLKKLSGFRKVRNKFQRALHRAQKKAKDNPKLWFYDEKILAPIPMQGLELETSNYNLLKLWERGFCRRPDIRETTIQIGRKTQDIATKKDWEAAEKNPRLRNYKKGPEGWIWVRHECYICFWRKELPFNPDAYLRRFQSGLMVLDRRIEPEKPPDSTIRLQCEYALFAALHDYLEALGTTECDYLTDIEKDDWAVCLCRGVESFFSFFDKSIARLLQIDIALDHVKDDLKRLAKGKATTEEKSGIFIEPQAEGQKPEEAKADSDANALEKQQLEKEVKPLDAKDWWECKNLERLRVIDSNLKRVGIVGTSQLLKDLKKYLKKHKRADIAGTLSLKGGRIVTTMHYKEMFLQK